MEHQFAAAVSSSGEKAGFLQYLDAGALLFRPRPVVATDFFKTAPDDPGLLEWSPAWAVIAKGGDLGFTTGPWRYRESRTNAAVNATGQYVTVWRRTPSGWRAALDAGVGSPASPFSVHVEMDGPNEPRESLEASEQIQRGRGLKETEESFGRQAAREGEAAALEMHGHKRVWVLRQGYGPVIGRGEGVRFLAANRRRTRDALGGFQVSATGDLGYAWGESELLASGPTPAQTVRSWVRVWQRSGWSGTWRVLLDLAVDYPPLKP